MAARRVRRAKSLSRKYMEFAITVRKWWRTGQRERLLQIGRMSLSDDAASIAPFLGGVGERRVPTKVESRHLDLVPAAQRWGYMNQSACRPGPQ
jgi:hypothetical protein